MSSSVGLPPERLALEVLLGVLEVALFMVVPVSAFLGVVVLKAGGLAVRHGGWLGDGAAVVLGAFGAGYVFWGFLICREGITVRKEVKAVVDAMAAADTSQ